MCGKKQLGIRQKKRRYSYSC